MAALLVTGGPYHVHRYGATLCDARDTSPGRIRVDPPPRRPEADVEWCGARKGREGTSERPGPSRPATEWSRVTSRASSRVMAGRIVGRRRASMVLPAPGGPTIRRL